MSVSRPPLPCRAPERDCFLYESKGKAVLIHAMKACVGNRGITPFIFHLVTRQRKWSAWDPDRFIPGNTATGTQWTGAWEWPRARMLVLSTIKSLILIRKLKYNPLVLQTVALSRLRYPGFCFLSYNYHELHPLSRHVRLTHLKCSTLEKCYLLSLTKGVKFLT